MIRGASIASVAFVTMCAACGLGRPPSPTVDAGTAPALDGGSDASPSTSAAPLPSPDELVRLAEETIRGGHAGHVHDGHAPFTAALDLPDGGCGRVALVADQAAVAQVADATGPRGAAADAGARVLTLVPPGGPVCGATVTLHVADGAATVRWTTVTR